MHQIVFPLGLVLLLIENGICFPLDIAWGGSCDAEVQWLNRSAWLIEGGGTVLLEFLEPSSDGRGQKIDIKISFDYS